ncbi:hypothetical protein JVU11DRAFT_3221 [Chiua virens]|nr:hypothetical protein JVU11DRAFT_3221 [Chiua virens]
MSSHKLTMPCDKVKTESADPIKGPVGKHILILNGLAGGMLFLDSTQDACKEECSKAQLSSAKKDVVAELARYIFEKDPLVGAEVFQSKRSTYVGATSHQLASHKTKYTKHLRSLGQTGAGLPVDIMELETMQYKSVLDKIRKEFL